MKAILIDTTRCTGCSQCVRSCTSAGGLPPELPRHKLGLDGLSSRRKSTVVALKHGGYAKKQCLHCLEPACVDACPVGAMTKTASGAVTYDRDKCMGCRYCMLACPAGIPRYEWDQVLPYVVKCEMCHDRVSSGKSPVCVSACQSGVLKFGERAALLNEAKDRIADGGERYVSHVFGEHELGGTSVMYLANQPLSVLGWPNAMGDRAMKSYTWPLISKTPWMALGVASFLVGTQFVISRRMQLAAENKAAPEDAPDGSAEDSKAKGNDR